MKTYKVVLCDREEEFVLALMNYLNRSTQIPVLSMAFTKAHEMLLYLKEHKVDLIVTEVIPAGINETENKTTPLLYSYVSEDSEKAAEKQGEKYCIFKYSPASEYIRMMLRIFGEEEQNPLVSGNGTCIAVYSPIGRSGKTLLAQALCRYYSSQDVQKKRSIYLGMEEYGVLGYTTHEMEELLYFIKQRSSNISMRMKSLAMEVQGYDSIPSAISYEELKELNSEDFRWLLTALRQEGVYDYALADLGSASITGVEVLQEFDVVYLPYLQDSDSKKKWQSFCRYLEQKELADEILEHWYPVHITRNGISCEEIQLLEQKRRSGDLEHMSHIQCKDFCMNKNWHDS